MALRVLPSEIDYRSYKEHFMGAGQTPNSATLPAQQNSGEMASAFARSSTSKQVKSVRMARKTRNIRLNIKSTSKSSNQKTLLSKIVCGKIGDSHNPRSSLIKYIGSSFASTPGTKAGTIDVGCAVTSSQVDKVQQHTFKLDLRKNKHQRLGRGDF